MAPFRILKISLGRKFGFIAERGVGEVGMFWRKRLVLESCKAVFVSLGVVGAMLIWSFPHHHEAMVDVRAQTRFFSRMFRFSVKRVGRCAWASRFP